MSSSSRQRSGAHRPRRRPGAVALALLGTVAVVAAVVVGVRLLTGPTSAPDAARPAASAQQLGSPGSPSPSSPRTVSPSPNPSPSPALSASSLSSGSAAVDRSAAVTVLNGSGRAGLATRAAATLRSAGWSLASTGNYPQTRLPTQPSSTVYYSGTDLRATARAVSEDLPGTQRVQRSTEFGDGAVTVVLGPDYSG
ncbi:MAG TPA: LytR C-terminal domain-containing protein [Actinomycetales bacterium]|nr:LytR C-terminal domain-containing protein [Actinomycetales bacterium]